MTTLEERREWMRDGCPVHEVPVAESAHTELDPEAVFQAEVLSLGYNSLFLERDEIGRIHEIARKLGGTADRDQITAEWFFVSDKDAS